MIQRINAADLHQRIGEIIAQVRYTGERFLIERRGKPVAVVISVQEWEQLQGASRSLHRKRSVEEQLADLERASAVQKLILAQRKGKLIPNSVETIRQLREERMQRVTGHR